VRAVHSFIPCTNSLTNAAKTAQRTDTKNTVAARIDPCIASRFPSRWTVNFTHRNNKSGREPDARNMRSKLRDGVTGYVGAFGHFHTFHDEASRRVARLAARTHCDPIPDYFDCQILSESVLALVGPSGQKHIFAEVPQSFAPARKQAVETETAFLVNQRKAAVAARKKQ
jgi:hypothetical protein